MVRRMFPPKIRAFEEKVVVVIIIIIIVVVVFVVSFYTVE